MKEEEIKIRISETIKKDFVDICEFENTTMSNKLHEFIIAEVNEKKLKTMENSVTNLLSTMGFNNITIIGMPTVNTLNGKLVSGSVDGKTMTVGEYQTTLLDFVSSNKDKKIFLYLMGCDLQNNRIRAFVI